MRSGLDIVKLSIAQANNPRRNEQLHILPLLLTEHSSYYPEGLLRDCLDSCPWDSVRTNNMELGLAYGVKFRPAPLRNNQHEQLPKEPDYWRPS
jgi:hypothetical protein